jgi:acid phosphatase family membrane protein YuiD
VKFGNIILLLCFISWALAQLAKGLIQLITEGEITLAKVLSSGGMPSSHSAFVTCCAVTVGTLYGFDSGMFAIATVMAVVVMYDACNVRRQSGEQAKAINLTSNLTALVVFALHGQVILTLGLAAAACNMLGNYVGSGMALSKGARITRPIILVVLALLFVRILMGY